MSKAERITYIAIIACLIAFGYNSCQGIKQLSADYSKVANSEEDFRVQHLADSSKLYSMAVKEVDYKVAIEAAKTRIMALEILKLKKPKEVVGISLKEKYKAEIPLAEPVKFDSTLYLKLPSLFRDSTEWFSISGKIDTRGKLVIDSMITRANLTYGVGDTLRKGIFNRLLNKRDQVVRLHVDNPNMDITGLNNVYLTNKKRWYQTTLAKVATGVIVGVALVSVSK